MKNYRLANFLQDTKTFWRAKRRLKRLTDAAASHMSSLGAFAGEQRIQVRLLRHSLRGMSYQIIISVVFIAVIEGLSWYFNSIFGIDLAIVRESEDTVVQLLVVLVTVVGVMLGLYFTTLSAVAGGLFLRAPASLQSLFLSDRSGQQYIKTLALAFIIGILYLLWMSSGYLPSLLGPGALVVVCLYVIMRFLVLGARAFYFIHPGEASGKLQSDLRRAINHVVFGGFGSEKEIIQLQARLDATRALQTFDKLVDFGVDPAKLSGAQLVTIAQHIGAALQYYFEKRSMIASESAWFVPKYQHAKWLTSNDNALIMALNTGTTLSPTNTRNTEWFEEAVIGTILKILKQVIMQKDWSSAQECLEILVVLAENSGQLMSKSTTTLIVDRTIEVVSEAVDVIQKKNDPLDREGLMAMYDGMGRLPISALIGISKLLHDSDIDKIVQLLAKMKWDKPGNFFLHKLPLRAVTELEKISQSLANEKPIEGKRISPNWYLQTLALHNYLLSIRQYYDHVKSYGNAYITKIDELINEKDYPHAAAIASRNVEFSNKLLNLGQNVAELIEKSTAHHSVKDLKWVEIDAEAEKKAVNDTYNAAIDKMTSLIMLLNLTPEDELANLPDYLGQSIVLGMDAVYDAARNNDVKRLQELFPSVLLGVINSREGIRKEVQDWLLSSQIVVMTEPLEDILSLSGFIKIYAELYENDELWKVCENTWNAYLAKVDDAPKVIEMFAISMSYRDTQFSISPRATLRSNWDIQFRNKLDDVGVSTEINPNPFGRPEEDRPTHPSALVRYVARGAGMMDVNSRTVFMILYLSNHASVANASIDFPDRRDFERMYERELHRYDEQEEEPEDVE